MLAVAFVKRVSIMLGRDLSRFAGSHASLLGGGNTIDGRARSCEALRLTLPAKKKALAIARQRLGRCAGRGSDRRLSGQKRKLNDAPASRGRATVAKSNPQMP